MNTPTETNRERPVDVETALAALYTSPTPDGAFVDRLDRQLTERGRLLRERERRAASPWRIFLDWWRARPSRAAGTAGAALVVLVVLALVIGLPKPKPVSAQEVLRKAQASLQSPAEAGVQSYALTETQRYAPLIPRMAAFLGLKGDEIIQSETRRWFQAPNRWRNEYRRIVVAPDGKVLTETTFVLVSDGTDLWQYSPQDGRVTVNRLEPGVNMNGREGLSPFGVSVFTLADLLQRAGTCYDAKVTGEDTVAGRAAYVVDLGPTKCPSADAPEMNGRLVIWVDQQTFFVLKQEQHNLKDDTVIMTSQAQQIQYNGAVDAGRFAFTPPAGVKVQDLRPKPTPSAGQYQEQLRQLAGQLDFPAFAPAYVPQGLTPLQPRIEPAGDAQVPQLTLSYVSPADADWTSRNATAGPNGIAVMEQRATYSLVMHWTQGAEPITLAGGKGLKGWLRRGTRNADGTGSSTTVMALRDGTLVSVSSFAVTPEELVKVAESLEAVPGGHAALPDPEPLTLAELRKTVSFPIFVPTDVPAGLAPEPPIGGSANENVEILYHTADGAVGLDVQNGTLECCPGLQQMAQQMGGEDVTLPNGTTAKLIGQSFNLLHGGMTLWWQQDGATVAISGPNLSAEDLKRIAASVSKTADLNGIEPLPARPTPTPAPTPSYTVLRPTWLPEPMTVTEQVDGQITTLGFDPHPSDPPHQVMTLIETPRSLISPGGSPDPQATQEKIGGYDVTVIHRGESCTMYTWDVGELNLTLVNTYDPPGRVRYMCEQMRKVVESIR